MAAMAAGKMDMTVLKAEEEFEDDPERPRHIVTVHGQGYRFVE